MNVEFGEVPGAGLRSASFPRDWVGTTTPVRVDSNGTRLTLLLGLESFSGPSARGIFSAGTSHAALVVDRGTGYLIREGDVGLEIARVPLRPIVDALQTGSFVVLVSFQEIWLQQGDALFVAPVDASDGFEQLRVTADDELSGRAWIHGDWSPFSVSLGAAVSDMSKRVELNWCRAR